MTPAQLAKSLAKPLTAGVGAIQGAGAALWTFPSVLGSAILIAWAAEAAQFLVSQGLALAILAWLQTLPEFAVEAVIAWQAGHTVAANPADPNATALMSANFTGSLRLIVGLGWPMIYATAAFYHRRKSGQRLGDIHLDNEHAVEVVFLLVAIAYFFVIWAKGTLSWVDSVILAAVYFTYLFFLNKIPPQEEEQMEDIDRVPRFILSRPRALRNAMISALFIGGGLILYFAAEPFLESLKGLAAGLGISTFVFVQWIAPFLSEFPEKVSAFNWARRVRMAPMALMNMVSSNINQWTMLAAMLPIAFALALGHWRTIEFNDHQRLEILLTISQSLLGALLLANMKFSRWEAGMIFSLWAIQFVLSGFEKPLGELEHSNLAVQLARAFAFAPAALEALATRGKEVITGIYFAWSALLVAAALKNRSLFAALVLFPRLVREHW